MFFQRKIYSQLAQHLQKRQMTVIVGMRRTGKTTLLKQLLEHLPSRNKLYIDLERLDSRDLFREKNYEGILAAFEQRGLNKKEKMYIALDELQFVPQAVSVLKYLYDHYEVKFIVTGSSSYYLKNLFSESLAGRKKIFELYPLDFGEFLTFKQISWKSGNFIKNIFSSAEYERIKVYYEEYIEYGGFPEVALTGNRQDKTDILSDIVSSYVNIDVNTLLDIRDQEVFYALMKMLASRVGTKLDYAKIARLIGISRPTIMAYIHFLEKTYFFTLLPVIAKNPDREIVKAKKIYCCDNGILNALADVGSGKKFENAIFNQLKFHGDLSYYSLKTGQEIDFILNATSAFEVKESPTQSDTGQLSVLAKNIHIRNNRLIGRKKVARFQNYIWGGDIR
ncbi:MAG: ATPase [Candidatus Kerfeldbacteria bacterium RIFCSPHIGHO2_02_FULL_42_14]|uniref:ATPase n=1 Tax=Candidatus Kerfeldbacteria bacterium RIFCSPHIGHO2_02_FULL_42_14 TaxID=1798540 RepID=A0A1G2AUF1_9BACT|nr:MAG: ATPase [Candidatus Kerfeldbacteria bacterium RIFCSPHIGHO2_02_FULL_42_14]OGY80401.1 MAG: ATPase [Candidatus Kerfeldbacteria bacterium RIFCSPHIGHO2_12_FULL_42_13]OGY83830.1 MAG: ATPase [Candidatus Kerfeldbacteria bacterium RIFCSPLOWO2_02_FULL_42_19]OGY85325.1 MAG: ATPase [Candidatus Kerfeldbacteria bacterium RIFCSPLOWO2_12_FULL_43_9]